MGVADLVAAFNSMAEPSYSARRAFMVMEPRGGLEWSRLTFSGITADGAAFSESVLVPPGEDLLAAARHKAQELLANVPKLPAPEGQP